MVGDSTQIVYAGNLYFPAGDRGPWFNSSVGFGTLGYALPAAIGAKLAQPERPVIALIGDGGIQFTLAELGAIRDAGAPVIVLVWNNGGYREIESFMEGQAIAPDGMEITPPGFHMIAEAYGTGYFGLQAARLEDELEGTLRVAREDARGVIIEVVDW